MPSERVGIPFVIDDFSRGVIDDCSVSDALLPKNAVRKAVNVRFDYPRGAVVQRLGTTAIGGKVDGSNAILGIHNLRVTGAGGTNRLIAACNGSQYYLNGSTWTSNDSGLSASARCRYLTYLDVVAMLNGTDAPRSWDGSAGWITTAGPLDIGNWPNHTRFAAILNGRVYTAGDSTNPCRLYYSSIVTAGAISWTSGNGYVDVSPNDGTGSINMVAGNARLLLIFKDRSFFRYDGNDLQRIGFMGTPAIESVFTDDNGITYYFGQGCNTIGFYATTGGYPKKISRPVKKWIDAIDPAYYPYISGYTDGIKCYWSIGSATISSTNGGSTTYSNAWLVYTIADQTWEARDYASRYQVFAQYITSTGAMTVAGGGTDGYVQTMNSGYTDNGQSIVSEVEFGPFIGSSYSTVERMSISSKRGETKKIVEVMTFAQDYQGLKFLLAIDRGPWIEIGAIARKEQRFKNIPFLLRGNVFHPKITCVNSGPPFMFEGMDFYNVVTEGYSMG